MLAFTRVGNHWHDYSCANALKIKTRAANFDLFRALATCGTLGPLAPTSVFHLGSSASAGMARVDSVPSGESFPGNWRVKGPTERLRWISQMRLIKSLFLLHLHYVVVLLQLDLSEKRPTVDENFSREAVRVRIV
jgi:hypothetical protein